MYFYYMFFVFMLLFMVNMVMFFNFFLKELSVVLEMVLLTIFSLEFKFYFYLDYFSIVFMMVVSFISLFTFLFSKSYMANEKNIFYFSILTFMFIISMFMVILGLNMWVIMWGWDGLGVISFLLVIFYQSEYSNYCGMITLLINRIGDVGMILSMFIMFNWGSLDLVPMNMSGTMLNMFIILVVLGGLTKSAQFPFSSWLPLAMAAPTPISALVHSSTLVTAGVYLLIRLNLMAMNNSVFCMVIVFLSLLTMFMSGVCAISDMDLKKIIAFSTLSQLSLMFLIVLAGNELMGFYHILTHAIYKSLLFLCSGVFIHEFLDNQDVRNFNFLVKINPLVVSVFFVCSLSLMGVPFLSGFYSKDLILEVLYSMNLSWVLFLFTLVSIMFTSFYSFRMMYYGFFLGSKGYSMIYLSKWDIMYTVLIFMVYSVFITGSAMNWFILDKLQFLVMGAVYKNMNLMLLMVSVVIFYFFNISFINNKMLMFFFFFFLNTLGGYCINKFMNKIVFLSVYSEFMLKLIFVSKVKNMVLQISMFFLMSKFVLFYMLMVVYLLFMVNYFG